MTMLRQALRITILLSTTLLFLTSARAQTVCWDATSGLLPSDALIPSMHRFTLENRADFVSMAPGFMHVADTVYADRAGMTKLDISPLSSSDDWTMQIVLRMNSNLRDALNFGSQSTVSDGTRSAHFGVSTDTVGFIDSPSTQWVDGLSFSMDTTDDFHTFTIRKVNQSIELTIDGNVNPSLIVPYDSLPSSAGSDFVYLFYTSIIGMADFDIRRYSFEPTAKTLRLSACPPVASTGETLTFAGKHGMPGSINGLFISSLNGNPFSRLVLFGNFDATCAWNLPVVIPGGIPSLNIGFVLFGFDKTTGLITKSQEVPVLFL